MNKRLRIAGIIGAVIVSIVILSSPSNPPPIPEPTITSSGNESVQILAKNLDKPWAIELVDNRIFFTESSGKIRVIDSEILLDEPLASLRVADVYDGGLLGIVAHPDFSNNSFLYVYYTYEEDGNLWNKILRIKENKNKIQDAQTIFDKIPGSIFGNGGVLKFGPDKKLYVGTAAVSDTSHDPQNLDSLSGKILRLNDDGSIPDDNPIDNSPVFSYGHRNVRGMDWDQHGNLYASELGPSKNDEINLIQPGKNYGWPNVQCSNTDGLVSPIICYDPSLEPGGLIFYTGNKLDMQNNMILASLKAQNLFKIEINDDGSTTQNSIMGGLGRIRDVIQGDDGYIYIITSNTDGKGFPSSDDDMLLRIIK